MHLNIPVVDRTGFVLADMGMVDRMDWVVLGLLEHHMGSERFL